MTAILTAQMAGMRKLVVTAGQINTNVPMASVSLGKLFAMEHTSAWTAQMKQIVQIVPYAVRVMVFASGASGIGAMAFLTVMT